MKNIKNYCVFYVVRHGETTGNVNRILQGHSNYPLTKLGILQAKEAAEKMEHIRFDEVFSSDLMRAKKTAELIVLERKIAVKTTERLRERSFGKYENKPYQYTDPELENLFKKFNALSEKEQFKFKFRKETESDEELSSRMLTFLRELSVAYPAKTILIVSHGGIMKATLLKLGFVKPRSRFKAIKNLAYFKLLSDGVDFFIKETEGIEVYNSV